LDAERFDRLLLTLTRARSRRSVLGLLGALGLTAVASEETRATHTPGDCRHNGVRCTAGTQCCSGRCVRKRGTTKKFCRQAPDQGICTIEDNICGTRTTACDAAGTAACVCFVTSRGFSFCGSLTGTTCVNCTSDAECVNRAGVGQAGDRCVPANPPTCCTGVSERLCVHACPDPATA
jgi:hypothetical protein